MAEIDDRAFDSMQEGSPDYVAGGAMMFDSPWQMKATSDYDDKYTPAQRGKFDESVGALFKTMYESDTNLEGKRDKIDIQSYIKDLDLNVIKERSLAMEKINRDPDQQSFSRLSTGEQGDIYWSKRVSEMADKHYGDISRIKDIAAKYWDKNR